MAKKKDINTIWIILIVGAIFLLFFTKTTPTKEFSTTGFQCYIGQTEYYTCPDGSKYLSCFCDNGDWLCVPDPAEFCIERGWGNVTDEDIAPVTDIGETIKQIPTYVWWILGGIIVLFILSRIGRR